MVTDKGRRTSLLDPEDPSIIMDHVPQPGGPPSSRPRARTNSNFQGPGTQDIDVQETQNARAMQVLHRVKEKLTGTDFKSEEELNYINQVDRLLNEATKLENLCQHYIGWCSFW